MLHCELDVTVDLVDVVEEIMSCFGGAIEDYVDVIQKTFEIFDLNVLHFPSNLQNLFVNYSHKDVGIIWGWFTAHTTANVLSVQLIVKDEDVVSHHKLKKFQHKLILLFITGMFFENVSASSYSIKRIYVCIK